MSFVEHSIGLLRAQGYKITPSRKRVLEALQCADKPLSPYELQRVVEQEGMHLNAVTIYRTLELFSSLNLVHKILSLGGFVKCTLGEKEGCHRYLICRSCGALQEFADKDLCQWESQIAQSFGFHAEHHLTEFSGLCLNCFSSG